MRCPREPIKTEACSSQYNYPGLPHCRWIFYYLSHQESPRILEWVAYPFSRGSSWPRNQIGVSCFAGGFFTSWTTRETILTHTTYQSSWLCSTWGFWVKQNPIVALKYNFLYILKETPDTFSTHVTHHYRENARYHQALCRLKSYNNSSSSSNKTLDEPLFCSSHCSEFSTCSYLNSYNTHEVDAILNFHFIVRKLRPREFRENQGSSEWWNWSLDPGHLSSKPLLVTTGCSYLREGDEHEWLTTFFPLITFFFWFWIHFVGGSTHHEKRGRDIWRLSRI